MYMLPYFQSIVAQHRFSGPLLTEKMETGVTIMYMEKGLDTGDMIEHVVVPIDAKETGESLHDKLAVAGGPLLLDVLAKLENGTAVRTPQNDADSCYAKKCLQRI